MGIKVSTAPCCWGVDDVKNPHLPRWELVLDEAAQAASPRPGGAIGAALLKAGFGYLARALPATEAGGLAPILGFYAGPG